MPSLTGQVVGAYTLRSLLGQGGMGSVWLAERTDGRYTGVAAVKLLNASVVGEDGEARLRSEGTILGRLRHPHIAQLIDAGLAPTGQPYLIREHVDGERIDAYCDAKRLSIEARLQLFLHVLAAVAHAHANLIVHRELKPSNVLVAKQGQVKLLDFGIAKLLEGDGRGTPATVTPSGAAVWSPEYAAPEQLTGGALTTATDVYALGALLYVLLTGQHPARVHTNSPAELVRAIVEIGAAARVGGGDQRTGDARGDGGGQCGQAGDAAEAVAGVTAGRSGQHRSEGAEEGAGGALWLGRGVCRRRAAVSGAPAGNGASGIAGVPERRSSCGGIDGRWRRRW